MRRMKFLATLRKERSTTSMERTGNMQRNSKKLASSSAAISSREAEALAEVALGRGISKVREALKAEISLIFLNPCLAGQREEVRAEAPDSGGRTSLQNYS